MNHALLIPRRRSGFSPLNFGSDLALWLDPSYGVYTDRSTQLTAASSQYWSSATNSGATNKLTVSLWIKPTTIQSPTVYISEADAGASQGWLFQSKSGAGAKFLFYFCSNGSSAETTSDVLFVATWTHITVVYDGTQTGNAARLAIYVNGSAVTPSFSGTIPASLSLAGITSLIGRWSTYYANACFDSLCISPVALSAADVTALYNAGAGLVYASVPAAQLTAIGASGNWYDFDGDGLDAHGSNDLTAVNGPTYTSGIASGIAGDGDVESLLTPRTGSNGTPPSYAARPIWTASSGKPYHLFDGSNDSISFGDVAAWDRGTGAFTLMFAAKGGDNADVAVAKDNYAGADNGILIARDTGAWGYWDGAALISFGADSGAASIFTAVRSGTGAGQVSVRRNGAEITTGTDARTLSNTKALVFGDSADAGHTLNGRLGDVVFVARALTAGELAQLETWAAARQAA